MGQYSMGRSSAHGVDRGGGGGTLRTVCPVGVVIVIPASSTTDCQPGCSLVWLHRSHKP